jgi:hypothetical protein
VDTDARRRWPLIPLVVALGVVVTVGALGIVVSHGPEGPEWVPVGTIGDVNSRGIVFVPEIHAYVVADPPRTPVTLIAESPQMGERVVYCTTSTWFEDAAHGSKFDGLGRYALGPAPRGLDRFPTTVSDGLVLVDPSRTILGPPRGGADLIPPAGPFCTRGDGS